jgi:hypothetical protein
LPNAVLFEPVGDVPTLEEDPPFDDDDTGRKFKKPCVPDCPGDVWKWHPTGRPFKTTIEIQVPAPYGGTCVVTVWYVYRNACAGLYPDEVAILDVDVPISCNNLFTYLRDSTIGNTIPGIEILSQRMTRLFEICQLQLAKDLFLKRFNSNYWTLEQKQQKECGQNNNQLYLTRVLTGICFFNQYNFCDKTTLKPCGKNYCCIKKYQICYDRQTAAPIVTLVLPVQTYPIGENCPDNSAGPRALEFNGKACMGSCIE